MQDFSQAVFWFSKASLQGDQPAQNELADCFEFGRGVKRNLPIALGIRRKLANEGYGHAQMLLGLSYFMDGIRLDWPTGIQTNYVQAYKWMSLAAAQEYPGAEQQRNEFVAEMNSQSVAFAQRLAREFVLKPASPLLLNGVTTNISSAPLSKAKEDADKKAAEARLVSWQHIQATNGADFAQYALGVRYLKGDGVSTNRSVARHWLKSASTNEHQAAIKLLREMSSDGK